MYKGKNIRVSSDVHDKLKNELNPLIKMSKFVEMAIIEKLERDHNIVREKKMNGFK